jgi:hypothetical protein
VKVLLRCGGAFFLSLLRAKGDLVGSRENWLLEDPTCNLLKMKFNGVSIEKGSRNSVD